MAGAAETEPSPGARYEALIRISNSLRAHKEPQGLFEILVRELRNVIPRTKGRAPARSRRPAGLLGVNRDSSLVKRDGEGVARHSANYRIYE
jgi:hypothetical protein